MRADACPFFGVVSSTPAHRTLESPIAIACFVDRGHPCPRGWPDVAIEALRPAERYQRRWPEVAFQRGLAYVRSGNIAAAVAEFKRLTDAEPAWPPASTVYPAAMLALARAQADVAWAGGEHEVAEFVRKVSRETEHESR